MTEETTTQATTDTSVAEAGLTQSDWRSALPEEYRSKYEEFKTPADVIKGYDNVLKMSQDKIKVPDKPDDKEAWDKVYTKLGRPEAADKYSLGDVQIDESIKGNVLQQFHALGLNNQQASGLLSFYNQLAETSLQQASEAKIEAQRVQAEGELKKLWGDAFEAKQADLNHFVNQHAADFFKNKPERGNDIELIKFMNSLYEKFGKEGDMKGGAGSPAATDGIKAQITSLRAIQDKAMPHGKEYMDAQAKINQLYVELAKSA